MSKQGRKRARREDATVQPECAALPEHGSEGVPVAGTDPAAGTEGSPAAAAVVAPRPTEWLFLATVSVGGESLAVRELTELGARARIHGPAQVRFHADASAIGKVFARARTLTSLAWRITSGTEDEVRSAAAAVPWTEQLPAGCGVTLDASAEHLLGAIPEIAARASDEDPTCLGTLCLIDERKGAVALLLDLLFERGEQGDPLAALALRFAGFEPGVSLALFGGGVSSIVAEATVFARGTPRGSLAPGSRWRSFAGSGESEQGAASAQLAATRVIAFEDDPTVREDFRERRDEALDVYFESDFLTGSVADLPETIVHLFADPEPKTRARSRERLAERLRKARRARHVVICLGEDLLEGIGRTPARKKTFEFEGSEWCVAISEPEALAGTRATPAAPALRAREGSDATLVEITDPDERAFAEILAENARLRRRWPTRYGTDAYRLYDRDLPSVPMVVDRYADALHITIYPPDEIQEPVREARLIHRAGETLGVDPMRVFVKRKAKRGRGMQHEVQAREGARTLVSEGGFQLIANLSDYVDTGIFLDHRDTRDLVRKAISGKRLLNLFCYTGAFTVAAIAGNAKETTSVDTSQTYLDWARENLALNEFAGEAHRWVRADALEFLRTHAVEESYDIVVVDPPTHSNRHGGTHIWDVQRDYLELFERLRPLLAADGVVYFSTNFRRFKLDMAKLAGWLAEEITPGSIPPDIGDRRVHRAWRMSLRPAT